jgi:glycosyltransferase involved in cell wall biosynthesis
MRILILTQKVDRQDDVLGFFHRWLEVFSQAFENITVVCLGKGEMRLPENVQVYSLGKEEKQSRLQYILRFYRYAWRFRKDYDVVFVHMNKEYVLLGGLLWRMLGKKVVLWYNHPQGTLSARIAGKLAHTILYTSSFSFFSASPKAQQMPVGVDTDVFAPDPAMMREEAILCLGRIAPIKNVDTLIDAAKILEEQGKLIPTHLYGSALPRDAAYFVQVTEQAEPLVEKGLAVFHGSVANIDTPQIYKKYSIYVNLTPSGSFDKTIIEAMASGCLVLASNKSFEEMLSPEYYKRMVFEERNPHDVARKIADLVALGPADKVEMRQVLRSIVEQQHSLAQLAQKLVKIYTT